MGPWKRLWCSDAALLEHLTGHPCQVPEPRLAFCHHPKAFLLTDKSSTVHGSKPSHGFVVLCFKLATWGVGFRVEDEQNPGMLGCIPASSCISWSQVDLNEASGVLSTSKAQQGSPPALVLWGYGDGEVFRHQSCHSATSRPLEDSS